MATDAFAHAVFGVELGYGSLELKLLEKAIEDLAADFAEWAIGKGFDDEAEFSELPPDERMRAIQEWLIDHPVRYAAIRKAAGVPDNAHVFYTGSSDDHPYRSATAADTWVIGFGLLAFPDVKFSVADFACTPDWKTWVTAG